MAERKTTHRSEKIRAKRETKGKRTSTRKPRASQSDSPSRIPPMVMRGGFVSMAQPKRKKKSKTPRRRYDIALSSPGVEISLPALPAISLGWRLLSGVLVAGLVVLLYHLWTAPTYQVQAAELEGNHYIDPETVNRVLNLYNKPIFMVDPQQMEADLQRAFPGLLIDSSVQIVLPASVFVSIHERVPVISWKQGSETLWVDADGFAFDPVGENDVLIQVEAQVAPPKPVVFDDGETDEPEGGTDALVEMLDPVAFMTLEMVAALDRIDDHAPKGVPLAYDPRHGLGWHDTKRNWDVYFGMDLSNIEEKLIVYEAIREKLREDGISPTMVSVEHIHAPYYRLEP